ncbi:MAG: hypothetical protein ACL7AX_13635 [Candidatus Arsenophonus phytopathogenicus]
MSWLDSGRIDALSIELCHDQKEKTNQLNRENCDTGLGYKLQNILKCMKTGGELWGWRSSSGTWLAYVK